MDIIKKVYLFIFIALVIALLCTGITANHYRNKYDRLVEQHRLELDAARARAEVLSGTIESIREEISGFGESLSRQRTNTAQLRELLKEARTRYEKMATLLNDSGNYNNNTGDFNSSTNTSNGEIENE